MERKEYNGWTNYETWCVALWMDNEEGSQRDARDMAEDTAERALAGEFRTEFTGKTLTDRDLARYRLAEALKRQHEENAPELGASVWADLLGAALSEVDWNDIARHYIDEVGGEVVEANADDESEVEA